MQFAFHIAVQLLGFLALAAFCVAFAMGFSLSRHDERLEEERKEPPGFRWWPKRQPAPTAADYPPEARRYWVLRDRSLKMFAVCIGLIAILAVVAAILDVPFDLK